MTCPLHKRCMTFVTNGHWEQKESCDICKTHKVAYLWVIGGWFGHYSGTEIAHDLYFSSYETFRQLLAREMNPEDEALIQVWVPKDFTNWDYIPDCY